MTFHPFVPDARSPQSALGDDAAHPRPDADHRRFARLLRQRRLAARLTQEELAERAGVSVRSIGAMERGRVRYPRPQSVSLLGRALGLSGLELDEFERLARDGYWTGEAARGAGPADPARPPEPDPAPPADTATTATITVPAAGSSPPRPAQLPPDVSAFTGRETLLARLDALLPAAGGGSGPLPLAAITGPPGVGKTALAVHWSHRVRAAFADGQLHVNLRGHAADAPLRPHEALAQVLHALGVPPTHIPPDLEEAAAHYRSLLADRRMLVVLDDARSAEQVRPLLPGTAECLVLVTSRDALSGLVARDGAEVLALDVLDASEATTLLGRVLGTARVEAELSAAVELSRLCDFLPLAVRIVAANLRSRPRMSLSAYADELRGGNRLAALEVVGDERVGLCSAFALSYAALQPEDSRLFRLLGLLPADVGLPAVAALAGRAPGLVQPQLARLTSAHLVQWCASDRICLHELPRLYAADLAGRGPEQDVRAALERLYRHYLGEVTAAADLLYPHLPRATEPPARPSPAQPTGVPPTPAAQAAATAWFDTERRNLVSAVIDAAGRGMPTLAWQLADALTGYFRMRLDLEDWSAVAATALGAAGTDGDPRGRVAALLSLGALRLREDRYEAAVEQLAEAKERAAATGWPAAEAAAVGGLGDAYRMSGDLTGARRHLAEAVDLNRRASRPAAEAVSLSNLGLLYHEQGRLGLAAEHYRRALALHRRLSPCSRSTADNLVRLGDVGRCLGKLQRACRYLEDAVALQRVYGDKSKEAYTLRCLAEVYRDLDETADAAGHAETALLVARSACDRRTQAQALQTLASIEDRSGRHARAVQHHQEATDLATAIGNRYTVTEAVLGLAEARLHLGHRDRATEHARDALELARSVGYRLLIGQARTMMAVIELAGGLVEPALEHARHAVAGYHGTDCRPGEAVAQLVLAAALLAAGDRAGGGDCRRRARELLADTDFGGIDAGGPDLADIGRLGDVPRLPGPARQMTVGAAVRPRRAARPAPSTGDTARSWTPRGPAR